MGAGCCWVQGAGRCPQPTPLPASSPAAPQAAPPQPLLASPGLRSFISEAIMSCRGLPRPGGAQGRMGLGAAALPCPRSVRTVPSCHPPRPPPASPALRGAAPAAFPPAEGPRFAPPRAVPSLWRQVAVNQPGLAHGGGTGSGGRARGYLAGGGPPQRAWPAWRWARPWQAATSRRGTGRAGGNSPAPVLEERGLTVGGSASASPPPGAARSAQVGCGRRGTMPGQKAAGLLARGSSLPS